MTKVSTEQYTELVKKVSKRIYQRTLDNLSPSQSNSELKKDIEQDVWLELYSLKAKKPEMHDLQIEKHLTETVFPVNSLPDTQVIYTDKIEEFSIL